jgi:EAL domain-containing protein (putative c-di-GMP-specific phosphodiesterase class I)
MTTAGKILVIDDDPDVGELILAAAQGMGLLCKVTTNIAAFFENLGPDVRLIFVDLMMPEMDGIELLRLLRDRKCKARIVLISGIEKRVIETASKLAQSLGLSVVGHLHKPFRLKELEEALQTEHLPGTTETVLVETQTDVSAEELRAAIERNEFVVHYQPQISLATGTVTGIEALVRWLHPTVGLIYPDNFISRAESYGLIDQLQWLIVDRALAETTRFATKESSVPRVSINFSIYSLRNLDFPEILLSLARKHHIPPQNLAVEITETGLINEPSVTLDILTRLRMKNIDLSIDDFGTGYSMMRQLQDIPATELKIDKSLVQGITHNGSDRIMVEKTIELGHGLDMNVIAEGVETLEQLNMLRQRNCDAVQGYLISRPLPPADLIDWLSNYAPPGSIDSAGF